MVSTLAQTPLDIVASQESLSSNLQEQACHYINQMRQNGFVVVRNFFDPAQVEQAHREIDALYTQDLQERAEQQHKGHLFSGSSGVTKMAPTNHIIKHIYGKSPTYDAMMEKILTDPLSAAILKAIAGEHFRLRGYNVRKMNGKPDHAFGFNPPHEWHRDSLGEFGIGVPLTDIDGPNNAATAFVPGSHLFPFCPRWNAMFGLPLYTSKTLYEKKTLPPHEKKLALKSLLNFAFFNRLLAKKVLKNATGSYGRRGDFYIFLNDTWHGREPNAYGKETMVAITGVFPTDFPLPDHVDVPSAEVLAKLPPTLARRAQHDHPVNTDKNTVIHEMLARRQKAHPLNLFFWARAERQVANVISGLAYRFFPSLREPRFQAIRRDD